MTASAWIATIALLIAIFQLSRTLRWNQMNAALTWFDPKRLADIEKTTDAALQKIGIKYQLEQQSLRRRKPLRSSKILRHTLR